jgi:hypothetical protein
MALPKEEAFLLNSSRIFGFFLTSSFGFFKLHTLHHKIEKQGFALKRKGPARDHDFFNIKKYKEILDEPVQRIREFETVIIFEFDYGAGASNGNAAWHGELGGFIKINLEYEYKRRSEAIKKRQYSIGYNEKQYLNSEKIFDYYDIPRDEDPLTYMPTETDLDFTEEDKKNSFSKIIVPYSPRKLEILEMVTQGSKKMGDLVRELLFNIEKYEIAALPDKTNEVIGVLNAQEVET